MQRRRVLNLSVCTIVVWATAIALGPHAQDGDPVADHLVEQLQRARVEHGVDPLERRAELDAVARERASEIAALPHAKRLSYGQTAEESLRAVGIRRFIAAATHLDMVRGYPQPEVGLARSWQNHRSAWERALAERYTSVGAAVRRADDGWVIFVALFVEDLEMPEDLREFEQEMVRRVNELRADHGLDPLVVSPALAAVARRHSEDMAARDYLDHTNLEGLGPPERVSLAGIRYAKLSENVALNRGHKRPVAQAVEQWLDSPRHRASMLDPEVQETGVGVAVNEEGVFYFTQLYLRDGAVR